MSSHTSPTRFLPLLLMLAFSGRAYAVPLQGADPVSDDFERHTLGPNWTKYGGSNAGIVNNSDLGVPDTVWCFVGWTAAEFDADQFSEAEISLDVDPNMLMQAYVRRRASDLARYGFHWNGDPGKSQWEIKYDGVPSDQTKILAFEVGAGPAPGDRIRIEVCGSDPVTIRGYHNGQLKLMANDASPERITIPGVAGVVSRAKQGTTNMPPTPIFENWSGGSLLRAGVYCTAKINSLGCAGSIGASGTPSASAGSGFDITATNLLNNKFGLLFFGLTGPAEVPFQGGFLCVDAPIVRTPVQSSGGNPPPNDCSGSFSFDFNAYIAGGSGSGLVVGQEVWCQYWSRDPGFPPPDNTNLTDALHFTICD